MNTRHAAMRGAGWVDAAMRSGRNQVFCLCMRRHQQAPLDFATPAAAVVAQDSTAVCRRVKRNEESVEERCCLVSLGRVVSQVGSSAVLSCSGRG